jgi:hypothetical protein
LEKPECISPEIERQKPGFGLEVVEIFGDRERVPDLDAVMGEAGNQERRREQQQFGASGRIIGRYHVDRDVEAGHLAQEPAAQRPRTVVPAVDAKSRLGHGRPHFADTRLADTIRAQAESLRFSIQHIAALRPRSWRGRFSNASPALCDYYLAVQQEMH